MKDNISFREHPITTGLGLLLVIVALLLILAPYFYELKEEVEWYIPAVLGGLGIGFIGSPDSIFGAVKKIVDRKGNTI